MTRRKDNKGRILKQGESYRKTDGLYMYRWKADDGKTHCFYSATLEALREKEGQLAHDLIDGIRTGDASVTVNDIFDMWAKDKHGLKQTTYSNYIYMYDHFVRDSFGIRKVQKIRKSDVRRYYNDMIDTGKLAINTLETVHNILHQVFKVAVEDSYIRTNPADDVLGEVKRAHSFETPKRYALTIGQQHAFLNYIANTPQFQHWLPLMTFFLGTGCRVSEVVSLRWQDIDFDSNLIDINHNMVYYQRDKGKCYFAVTTPKTSASTRIIPMLPEVRQALLDERHFQKENEITCQSRIDGYTDFIFLNRFGHPHNPETINRTISRITRAYNEQEFDDSEKEHRSPLLLPHFSCHNLRHTFATRYCENETNLKVIQEILGHKDIATTMDVYAEATKDAKVRSFESLHGKLTLR